MTATVAVLLIWVLLLSAVVWVVWRTRCRRSALGAGASPETAREVLERRYERGAIERQDYERLRADLASKPAAC